MKKRISLIVLLTLGLILLFTSCINVDDTKNEKFTVTFMNEGEVYAADEYLNGSTVVFPEADPEKAEDDSYTYEFKGWSLTEGGELEEEGAIVSSDLTYYAVYDAQEKQPVTITYTVTFFDGVTGEVLKTEKVEKGKDAQPPEAPEHEGYTFIGWDGDYTNITGRTDITAKYEKKSYTLVRHYLGKEMTETLSYGENITLEAVESPQGLQFMGWYTSESYDQTVEEAYPDGMPAADESGKLDIYAKYAFDFSGASIELPQLAVYGGDSVRVQTRTYSDIVYTFEWSDTDGEWGGSSDSAQFAFRRAGEQTVSVRITATYAGGVFTESTVLSQTVTVQKRALTIGLDVDNDTIVYGTAPEASVTYDGFIGNEQAELTKNVKVIYRLEDESFDGSRLNVGTYTVTLEGAEFANYEYTLPEKSLTVQKKALTVTVNADDFTYGESAAPSVSYDGFVYGDDQSVLGGSLVYSYTKGDAPYKEGVFTAGKYVVTASDSGYTSTNYEISYVSDTFTVAKKSASATLTAENITYGEAAQFGFTLSGVLEGDKAKFVPAYSVTKGGEPASAEKLGAGDYSLTATFADGYIAANYDLTVNATTFTVGTASLTIGVSVNKTYTYGETPSAKATFSGFVWGESVSALNGKAEFAYTKNGAPYTVSGNYGAGSYTVAVSGYTSANYEITYADPASFTVEKKALTLTVKMQNSDLKYGDAVVGDINAEGFVFGESPATLGNLEVIYLNAEGERVTEFPASDSAYTATAQAQSENYEIEIVPASFTVAKRALTIGLELESDTLVYGTAPQVTVKYIGFYSNEQAELTKNVKVVYLLGDESFDGSKLNVGTYTVTLEGADFANYEYTLPEKSLTVGKATLTVTVNADDFTYGESAAPSVSYDGFVYGDDQSVLGGSLVYSYTKGDAPYKEGVFTAGKYVVTASDSGYTSANYEINYVSDTFMVAKKSASVTLTAEDITYGETAQFGFTLSGVLEGDKAKFVPAFSVTKDEKPVTTEKFGAGDYSLTATFEDGYIAANYDLTVNATTFTVGKAALAVGVSVNKTYTYGETPSAKATFSGFVWDENEEALNGTAGFTYTKNGAPYTPSGNFGAGSYTVAVSGYTSENYEISYAQPASFTVSKAVLTLTVTTGKSVFVYGEKVMSEIRAEGFVFGESLATLGNPEVIYQNAEGERVTEFPASESAYTATVEAQSENYEIKVVTASFTVEKKALTIGLDLVSDTLVYGTAPEANVTYDGFIGNEQAELTKNVKVVYRLEDESFDGSRLNVGTYTVTLEGADFANYEYTLPEKSLTVQKKALTVTVSADDFTYGGSAAPSVSYDGFVYSDDQSVLGGSLVYSYTKGGAPYAEEVFTAGEYQVTATGYTSDNYEISYVSDTFTVAKKDITVAVTAGADSYTFGETISAEWEANGLVFGEDKSVLGEVSLVYYLGEEVYTGYPESKLFAAGSYTVTAEGFASDNYNILSVQKGSFTVEKRAFTVSASVSGSSGTQLSKKISFFESEEIFEFIGTVVLNTLADGDYIANDQESFNQYFIWQEGTYKIVVKGTEEDVTENFEISYDLDFHLSDQAFIGTITTPSQKTLTYDGKARSFGITVSGAEGVGYKVEYSVNDGEYSETVPSFTDAGKYTVRYRVTEEYHDSATGTYTIEIKKAANVISTAGVNKTYTYNGAQITVNSGASATYGEVVYSDNTFTDAGKYTVNLSVAESANYLSAQTSVEITVNKANYTVSAERQDYTYNGSAQGAEISVTALGDDVFTVTYNGEAAIAQYTNAGTHTVKYTVSGNENYNDVSGEYDIVIAKAENVISADGVQTEYTYNGTQITVNSGASATYGEVVYSDNIFTNAGDYKVKLSVAESDNYLAGSAEVQVTVKKADYAVTASDQEYTYNATAQGAAISVKVFGEDKFTVTYNGQAAVAQYTNADTYTVEYIVSGNQNYNDASGRYTVTINKAEVSVELPSNASSTYDGTSFSAPVSVSAADSGYVVTYQCNGEPIDPETDLVNAGTYVITYTVSGANYTEKTGSYTVIIDKAQATIGTDNVQTEYTYTGAAQTVLVSGKVTYTGDGVLTAEDYTFTTVAEGNGHVITVSASEGANYLAAEAKITLTVQKSDYTVSAAQQNYTYNGTAQGAAISVTALGDDVFTVTYNGEAAIAQYTNAGTHTVAYRVSGNENYNDASGEYNIVIAKAANSISTAGMTGEYDYTGKEIIVNSGASATYGDVVYSDNTFTNAGSYTVQLSVAETENYSGASATFKVTVNKATVQIKGAYQYTYNGQQQGEISVTAPDSTYEITFSYAGGTYDTAPLFKDAGTYTVSYSVKASQNYVETNGHYTVTIAQAQLTVNNPGDQSKEYDGEPFGTGVTVLDAVDDGYTVSYVCNGEPVESVQFTDRGEYVITYTVSGKNYETVSGTFTFTIEQASNEIDVSGVDTEYTYDGSLITVNSGASALFGEVVYSKNTFTNAGSYTVELSVTETKNYKGASAEVEITVNKAKYSEEDIPEQTVKDTDIVMGYNKTLADVELNDGFSWVNKDTELESGTFDAYYCADEANYERYEKDSYGNPLQITITARKEKVTVLLEKEYSVKYSEMSSYQLPKVTIRGENDRVLSEDELAMFSVNADTSKVNTAVGSTYLVTYTILNEDNRYFDVEFKDNGNENPSWLWVKILSVGTGGGTENATIEDALNDTSSGTIIVQQNTAFAPTGQNPYSGTGYYTVKSGVVLLVPYSDAYSTNRKDVVEGFAPVGSAYVTLTVTSGTTITVYGEIVVNAAVTTASAPSTSSVNGNFGQLEVQKDSLITFESGANFESMGFTFGEGNITVKSGATVYEPFALPAYKGGSISSSIVGTVFPVNQYALTGIICRTEFQSGSAYYVKAFVTGASQNVNTDVKFVSTDSASFMQLTGGSIYKWIDESNGKIHFELNGTIALNNISVDLGNYIIVDLNMSTEGVQVPIPGNFHISIMSGTTTVSQGTQMKLLPGAALVVEKEATLVVEGAKDAKSPSLGQTNYYTPGGISSYGADNYSLSDSLTQWQDGQLIVNYPYANLAGVYRTKPTFDYDATTPALFLLKGSLELQPSAYLAAEISAETGAQVILSDKTRSVITKYEKSWLVWESAKPTYQDMKVVVGTDSVPYELKEDYSPSGGEAYFTAYLTAKLLGGGVSVPEVGKTYLFGDGGWTAQN